MDNLTIFHTATAIAASAHIFMSGFSLCASQLVMPPLSKLPTNLALTAFRYTFENGAFFAVPANLVGLIGFATAAYFAPTDPLSSVDYRTRFLLVTATSVIPVAWTATIMLPGIRGLLKAEDNDAVRVKMGDADIYKAFRTWKAQNLVRMLLWLVAPVAAAATIFAA